jgi:hypothetical protein
MCCLSGYVCDNYFVAACVHVCGGKSQAKRPNLGSQAKIQPLWEESVCVYKEFNQKKRGT